MFAIVTGTIKPSAQMCQLILRDEKERLKQYGEGIQALIESEAFHKIVFCENSGYGIEEISYLQDIAECKNIKLELLSFQGNTERNCIHGKGWGEGEIMEYVFSHSEIAKTEFYFVKITGRLKVDNMKDIARRLKRERIYFNIPNRTIRDFYDTRIYAMPVEQFKKLFLNAYEQVMDEQGFFLERVYTKILKEHRIKVTNFPKYPRIVGISGSGGSVYSYTEWKCKVKDLFSWMNLYKIDEGKEMMHHVVRISDGLGNQMFQYAFAYALAKKTGVKVLIDPLFWGTSLRKYQLEEFRVTNTERMVRKEWDYILGFGPRNGRKFKNEYRERLIRKKYQMIEEKQIMHYDETIQNPKVPSFYKGFWQSPAYFEAYYDELRIQFVRKKGISVEAENYRRKILEVISVALHIRRTDYVRQEGNATLQLTFYKEALRRLQDKLGEYCLFVFTDDKEFVKENFHLCEYILVEGVSDLDEFELMRQCNHHIIANSTFSWWAAYLGDNKGGIVYAPLTGIWSKEFYPEEWKLIDTRMAGSGNDF